MLAIHRKLIIASLKRRSCDFCCWISCSTRLNTTSSEPEKNFKFSQSAVYPTKVNLMQNLYPDKKKDWSRTRTLLSRFFAVLLPLGVLTVLVVAFTGDHDLEVEEQLMREMPSYGEEMMKSKKYRESIERLRALRDQAQLKNNSKE